jgi:hypothetical protein
MNQSMVPWKSLSASLHVGVLTKGWTLAEAADYSAEDGRYFTVPIHFAEPFSAAPVVHLGLTGFDIDQRDSERLSLRAVDITNEGFVAEISTWRDTRVYSVEFSWLALGA